MKAANILIKKQRILKLADFGLARAISINKKATQTGTPTMWSPCGTDHQSYSWDRGTTALPWTCGVQAASWPEMWTRSPIMQRNTEQLSAEVWPGVESLNLFKEMEIPRGVKRRMKEMLKPYVNVDAFACDLIYKLLSLDPLKRFYADNALNHDFFWTDPMSCSLNRMLSNHGHSKFELLAPARRGGCPSPYISRLGSSTTRATWSCTGSTQEDKPGSLHKQAMSLTNPWTLAVTLYVRVREQMGAGHE